jgi:hypothetical protein
MLLNPFMVTIVSVLFFEYTAKKNLPDKEISDEIVRESVAK